MMVRSQSGFHLGAFRLVLTGLLLLPGICGAGTLQWTNPCSDAGAVACDVGDARTHDLSLVRIYGRPTAGGSPRLIRTIPIRGRECQPESTALHVQEGMQVWATAVDASGNESCGSNVIEVGPTDETSSSIDRRVVSARLFDIQGRLVAAGTTFPFQTSCSSCPSGVYFYKIVFASGRVERGRTVVVR